jgi:hypothetical protein
MLFLLCFYRSWQISFLPDDSKNQQNQKNHELVLTKARESQAAGYQSEHTLNQLLGTASSSESLTVL